MTTPYRAAAYHDPTTDALDAARMRADGLAAICIPDRITGEEFFGLLSRFADGGPFAVSGAHYGEPFSKPILVPTPELALLRHFNLTAQHRIIGSTKGWYVWEPEDGEHHVLFGESTLVRPVARTLAAPTEEEWQAYLDSPATSAIWREEIQKIRRDYTMNV